MFMAATRTIYIYIIIIIITKLASANVGYIGSTLDQHVELRVTWSLAGGLPQAASNGQELQGLGGLHGLRGTQRFSCTGRMRDAGAVAVAGAAWGAHSIHRRVGRKQNEHRKKKGSHDA